MITAIPAIDLINGQCVRLEQGDYATSKVYHADPLEMALRFEQAGISRLHLVDLDGAKAGKVINWKTLERITAGTRLQVDFGGGVKTADDVRAILDSGGTWVTVGSLAARSPEVMDELIREFGPDTWLLGADVRNGMIAVNGWLETTALKLEDFIQTYRSKGIGYFLCTDISKDGLLQGPAVELYRSLMVQFPGLRLMASGGVSGVHDLQALQQAGVPEVVVGKAIYEGRIAIHELVQIPQSDAH
jgi:phosphoribosylformimino-5-aminoimidazole carboxamide ribotide isomerase